MAVEPAQRIHRETKNVCSLNPLVVLVEKRFVEVCTLTNQQQLGDVNSAIYLIKDRLYIMPQDKEIAMFTLLQAQAILALLVAFGVPQITAEDIYKILIPSPTVYLQSTLIHADGTREEPVIQSPLQKPLVYPLPIKRLD